MKDQIYQFIADNRGNLTKNGINMIYALTKHSKDGRFALNELGGLSDLINVDIS